MWKDLFVDDCPREEFQNAVLRWFETVDLDWVLEAEYEGKVRPVGMALADYRAYGRGIEPHVEWFPWSTPRIRFECAANFLRNIRKEYKVFIYSTTEDRPFWDRLHKHRLITKGCKIADFYQPGEDAMFYYTQGPYA